MVKYLLVTIREANNMAKLQVQSFAKIPNEYVSVERSRGLSMLEERLVYMLINTMQKRYESTKKLPQLDYEFIATGKISFDDFINTMQIGAKDDKLIYQSLKDLFDYSLAVHTTDETRFIHLFNDMIIKHKAREIKYKFGEVFIEYFTGICRDYFQLSINEVIGLNSTHAIRIYQILKTKLHMDKKEHIYQLQELKQILNIDKKYTLYSNFKQFVLEMAKQQINTSEASEFHIDYKEIKTGKAVTSIEFAILPKVQNYYVETNQIAGYKLDQLNKQVKLWLKDDDLVVKHIAGKIQEELKHKKPSRAAIGAYLGTIEAIKGKIKK